MPDITYRPLVDQLRIFARDLNGASLYLGEKVLEHRYERTDDVHYRLQTWYPGPNPAPTNIVVARHEDTPEWLALILAVATVGDHLRRPTYPPPQAILWFATTPEFDLVTISRIGLDIT